MSRPKASQIAWSAVAASVMKVALKAFFWALVIALPVLGAWIGSSIAAYRNTATWVPIVAAVLAFPVLPLAWDALDTWLRAWRARARKQKPKRFLTFADRLIVRTMAVNLVFVAVLVAWFPATVFTALATRGDWFLDGSTSAWAESTRARLFAFAERLEWLWELTHENEFAEDKEDQAPKPTTPAPSGSVPAPEGTAAPKAPPRGWPFAHELHPAVASVPAEHEGSVEAVGKYLASQERDPMLLVKALHDYAADRIAYDVQSYRAGTIPSQDAASVLSAKKGVCAGYAILLEALGKAAGVEIVYVIGQSRDIGGNVDGQGHAWNAARIDGNWYLIDATWDAGYVNGDTFTKRYTTDYLLTPPEVFGLNHYPDDDAWQLRGAPITRGEFMRQPNIRPSVYANGFKLLSPLRSQITVDGDFVLELENAKSKWVLVDFMLKGADQLEGERCKVEHGAITRARCPLPGSGTYRVGFSIGQEQYGTYWHAGQFEVNRR